MPAPTLNDNALLTVAEGKDALGIASDDNTQDDLVTTWINDVSDEIEAEIDNPVLTREISGEMVGRFARWSFTLIHNPIRAITKIEGLIGNDFVELTNLKPIIVEQAYVNVSLPLDAYLLLRVTYDAGWDTAPADLKKVAREKIIIRWKEEGKGGTAWLGKSSLSVGGQGGGSENLQDMTERWERIFRRYRPLA
jgi:hypothetical protein